MTEYKITILVITKMSNGGDSYNHRYVVGKYICADSVGQALSKAELHIESLKSNNPESDFYIDSVTSV